MADRPAVDTFVETHALLAVMEDDWNKVNELLSDMLPGELQALAAYCSKLGESAEQIAYYKTNETRP